MLEAFAEHGFRVFSRLSFQAGVFQPLLGAMGTCAVRKETESDLDSRANLRFGERARGGGLEGGQDCRPQESDEDEIVEMPGLKRRILTVVGEGQQLARVLGQIRCIAVHPLQDAGNQDRRR